MRVRSKRAGRQRGHMGWKAVLLSAVLLVLIVSVVAAGFSLISPSNQAAASIIGAQPGSLPWNERQPVNVLFLGMDGTSSRATALAVASFDPPTHTVHLLSIPPSLWVTIPGFGTDRVANAYADGGAKLALITVESITRTVIPYYAALDPATFKRLVDAYGGLSLRPEGARPRRFGGDGALHFLGSGGPGPGGESLRMQRDAEVAGALRDAATLPENVLKLAPIINEVAGDVRTNFPYDQIPDVVRLLQSARIRAVALDESGQTVSRYRTGGSTVLLPDWQRIDEVTHATLGNPVAGGTVRVLNGSGVTGQAAGLSSWLRGMGVHVAGFGSAGSFNHASTQVVVNSVAPQRDYALARQVAAILQAPIVTRNVHGSKAPVAVVIGSNYQDIRQQ